MRCVAAGHVDYNVNVATEGEVEETPEGESSPPPSKAGIAAQAKAFFTSRFESKVRSELSDLFYSI